VRQRCSQLALLFLISGLGAASAPVRGQESAGRDPLSTRGAALEATDESDQSAAGYVRRHALVVGIDAYDDPGWPDLSYAVADARAVRGTLIDDYGFDEGDVLMLLDGEATGEAIEKALEDWAGDPERITPDDLFVFFFAGHGETRDLRDRGQRGYMVPADGSRRADGTPSWGSLTGMTDLQDASEAIPAKHALFVLDCCFGGLAVTRASAPVAAGLGSRARQVLTAGDGEQKVLDGGGRAGHSVFTGAVLDGLSGLADLNGDGVVSFGELYGHVGTDVERKTGGRQTPLQAEFPDHEGGSVAMFAPGVVAAPETLAERLASLERTAEEQLEELQRLADALIVQDLLDESDSLWPRVPARCPAMRGWLIRARRLSGRRPAHEASLDLARDEMELAQSAAPPSAAVFSGGRRRVSPELLWRHATFSDLVASLDALEARILDVEGRLRFAESVADLSTEGPDVARVWGQAIAEIERSPAYSGLRLSPQLGLVPLGEDPRSGLWEFACVQTGSPPTRGEKGALEYEEDGAVVMVLLPAGTFLMGSQSVDPAGWNFDSMAKEDEGPVHEVSLAPFFLSKHELTQSQWVSLAEDNPSLHADGDTEFGLGITGRHPVESVSWTSASRWLDRVGFALPTEAQWEYACRAGGQSTPWSMGNDPAFLDLYANLCDLTLAESAYAYADGLDVGPARTLDLRDGHPVHAPVGSYQPNDFGLHDLHGNLWEWTRDPPAPYWLGATDGDGLRVIPDEIPELTKRVLRGGAFSNPPSRCRSSSRWAAEVDFFTYVSGLRPSRSIQPPDK
jgi:formylglycine-generating enzyme required for sulfatase activity